MGGRVARGPLAEAELHGDDAARDAAFARLLRNTADDAFQLQAVERIRQGRAVPSDSGFRRRSRLPVAHVGSLAGQYCIGIRPPAGIGSERRFV